MDEKKIKLGQFFTKSSIWLKPQVIEFIKSSNCSIAYDHFKENFNCDWKKYTKVSSRNLSLIDVSIPKEKRKVFIDECNKIIAELRNSSSDILLTPFKGNTKNGMRRRRLDFTLARAIIEKAIDNIKE